MTTNKELSIYVHIPFCIQKCFYCDFVSSSQNEEIKEDYVTKLVAEIEAAACTYQEYQIKTVFFGGGTPSILSWQQIERMMESLHKNYRMNRENSSRDGLEVSIEGNPGTITLEKLKAYRRMGINRLSLGLQSANNEELKTLGRIHTYEEFVESFQLAGEAGFSNINVDIMSALPGQTAASYEDTLLRVIKQSPQHISAYSLIIEEGTPFYDWYKTPEAARQQIYQLPSEETERNMYEHTKEVLSQYGYERYEISNYAKKGFECKHNNVYWQRGNYLGFGSAAASMVENVRWNSDEEGRHLLSKKEQMEEFVFLGMRRMEGISKQKFLVQFGYPIEQYFGEVIAKMQKIKLIVNQDDRIYLTDKGIDISNYVFSEFLLD